MNPRADALVALRTWQRDAPDAAVGTASFPANLPVFAGHFPGRPLVPGVHQVALFALLLQRAVDPALEPVAITRGKWTAPVAPDEELELRVRWRPTEDGTGLIADCECLSGGRPTATCRLILAATGAPTSAATD